MILRGFMQRLAKDIIFKFAVLESCLDQRGDYKLFNKKI